MQCENINKMADLGSLFTIYQVELWPIFLLHDIVHCRQTCELSFMYKVYEGLKGRTINDVIKRPETETLLSW